MGHVVISGIEWHNLVSDWNKREKTGTIWLIGDQTRKQVAETGIKGMKLE